MSNYIMDLRKVVGHAPLLQAGASIIVENENGQVLLEKRTDNHQWGYAGGSIELGETVEEAAKRELFEEMGLVADEMELFYINSGEETHYIYPNGDEVYNVEIIYICRKYHGTIKPRRRKSRSLSFLMWMIFRRIFLIQSDRYFERIYKDEEKRVAILSLFLI